MAGDRYRLKTLTLDSGERYPILVDNHGMPHWHATLFTTTQLRNAGKTTNTMISVLAAIRTLYAWAKGNDIDLEARFAKRVFFNDQDLECLWHHLTTRRNEDCNRDTEKKVTRLPRNAERSRAKAAQTEPSISSNTLYNRLTYINAYLKWLAIRVIEQESKHIDASTMECIKEMGTRLSARRPPKRTPSQVSARRGLTDKQQAALLDLIANDSAANPFAPAVQVRNELMVLMLFHLGVRAGELLGLRVDDIDFQGNTVLITRRHGDAKDPRSNQPVAKTVDRRVPIADGLARRAANYVMNERRKVPGTKRHPYLFVTHRAGPFLGAPLSIPSLIKLFAQIQRAAPNHLGTLSAHVLRHTANDRFSSLMDRSGVSSAKEDKMRSYLMGWREGSGTAAVYTRTHVEETAKNAGLQLQEETLSRRRR
jgi:integrase